ncbi:hypothetical protein DITRI_Ditri07aG0175100 [Diplodiscus trichospermus]
MGLKFHVPEPTELRNLWDIWNIRGTILFSLLLQIVLIFISPFRKSTRDKKLVLVIWFAYLVADAAANYAVGLISNSQRSQSKNDHGPNPPESSDLLAFWAPFLLVHLGGPDTITAFALEDNQLWLRHLLSLGVQAVAVGYVFVQSLPNEKLLIPTVLMFLAGIIKYLERTRALYLASLDVFRDSMLKDPDPGPNYAKLMEEYAFKKDAKLPTQINMTPEPDKEVKASDIPPKEGKLSHLEVVHYAYKYFKLFRGLIVDLIFSFRERDESRDFFNRRTAEDAFRVIEVELNFIYGTLYTKVEVVHSIVGYIFRFIAFGAALATLGIFYFLDKKGLRNKYGIQGVEIGITYTLLLGAIALDIISFLTLIFSDRTFATVDDPGRRYCSCRPMAPIFSGFLALRKPQWLPCKCAIKKNIPVEHYVLATPLLFRRWSGSISSHNLIRYCLNSHSKNIHEFPSLCKIIVHMLGIDVVSKKFCGCTGGRCLSNTCGTKAIGFPKSIKKGVSQCCSFVFGNIKACMSSTCGPKATSFLRSVKNKVSQCGSYMYKKMPGKDFVDEMMYVSSEPFTRELWEFIFDELRKKSEFADTPQTAERISTARGDWVLTDTATDRDRSGLLKYVSDVTYDESLLLWHIATDLCYYNEKEESELNEKEKKELEKSLSYQQFSKILSDYMLYLLVFQPTMMSAVAGIGKIRFRDTCAEAERFFQRRSLHSNEDRKACKEILSVNTEVEPVTVKGDRSKSVLFHASMLAKELNRMETDAGEEKWKLLSRVWVELVSYAASHCRASAHAQEVSKGGELITFFWLLMAHFGLGEQFQINEGHARAKLLVGK